MWHHIDASLLMFINKRWSLQAASVNVIHSHVLRDPPLGWQRCSHTDLLPTLPHPLAAAAALGPVSRRRWSRGRGMPTWYPPSCPLRPPHSRRCSFSTAAAAAWGCAVPVLSSAATAELFMSCFCKREIQGSSLTCSSRREQPPSLLPPSAHHLFKEA